MDAETLQKQKDYFRAKLLSQFILVGIISAAFQFIINILDTKPDSNYTEVYFFVLLAILYLVNRKGHFKIALNATLLLINFAIFITFKLEPVGGVQYYYFPMILLSIVLHKQNELGKAIVFAVLPIFLFFVNTNQHFDASAYLDEKDFVSVVINFTTSGVVSSIAILYLIKMNNTNEISLIKANEEIFEVSKELKVNNQILAKTNNELDKFMYSSSHDLRAPLASILGLVNLARLEPLEKQSEYIEMIRDRVIGLDFFIKDIIDFSKNTHTDIREEQIDINELIELCKEHNQYIPGAKDITLIKNIETKKIKSDHYRLSSILTALIANAVKYHNLDQDNPTIWVDVKGKNPVEFTVRDNGMGIHSSIRPHIFNMFYRGNEKSTGSGLGLYIAREMLNSLHGTFEVTSQEGKGANFTFYVPNNI